MSKYAGFNSVQLRRPERSTFDLSHLSRITTRMGRLTPIMIMECIPSDTVNLNSEVLARLAPLLAPIYDMIEVYVHNFFVPNRLLWEEWEEFITGGRLGVGIDPVNAPIPPYINLGDGLNDHSELFVKSTLADYLGLPIFQDLAGFNPLDFAGKHIDVMPFAAYQRCWYDYYRDRNFISDEYLTWPLPSGELAFDDPDSSLDAYRWLSVRTRAYEHDYFTSALPFTQRGVEVLMPIAGTGSVNYLDASEIFKFDGSNPTAGALSTTTAPGGANERIKSGADNSYLRIENIDDVEITASSVSINDFRASYALQVWLERNAVGGSRYNESTLAHFGVRPQDSRLQRAEYISGGRIVVKINEVVSTAYSENSSSDVVPLANMAGHGISYGTTNYGKYFCPEHGFIISILSIMNPRSYHQGLPRIFRRRTFLDYPWPTFAKLGEQQVDKAELYASAVNLTPDGDGNLPLFGYQSRYADWKYMPNTNRGEFHDTLLFWTLTSNFGGSPVLGETFVTFDDASQDRIFAVNPTSGGDNFWLYVSNKVFVKRALPYFATPNTLGFS